MKRFFIEFYLQKHEKIINYLQIKHFELKYAIFTQKERKKMQIKKIKNLDSRSKIKSFPIKKETQNLPLSDIEPSIGSRNGE